MIDMRTIYLKYILVQIQQLTYNSCNTIDYDLQQLLPFLQHGCRVATLALLIQPRLHPMLVALESNIAALCAHFLLVYICLQIYRSELWLHDTSIDKGNRAVKDNLVYQEISFCR